MLTKLITLFVMNVGDLLVDVLGELNKNIKAIDPPYSGDEEGTPLNMLVGRVVKLGPNYERDQAFEDLAEDDLVLFRNGAGHELRQDDKRYRRIDRNDIVAALLKSDLEDSGIRPEDLIIIGEPVQAAESAQDEAPPLVPPQPPPMINIEFINGRGLGFAHKIQVREGLTLKDLLDERGIDGDSRVLAVLRAGEELVATADLVIEEGDHVEALPVQVTGFADSETANGADDENDEDEDYGDDED